MKPIGTQLAWLNDDSADKTFYADRGGGKSVVLLMDFMKHARARRGKTSGLLVQKTFGLLDGTLDCARLVFGTRLSTYSANRLECVLTNGARLRFVSASDLKRLVGLRFSWVGVDNIDLLSEAQQANVRALSTELFRATSSRPR